MDGNMWWGGGMWKEVGVVAWCGGHVAGCGGMWQG